MEDNFSTEWGGGEGGSGSNARVMGSNGEQQMEHWPLAQRPPPAVQSGF